MKTLIWSPGFKRSFKHSVRHKPELKAKIEHALNLLIENPFHPLLHTHKLKGDLAGSWACIVDFEYRIVFEFINDPETEEDMLLLEAVGTHEESLLKEKYTTLEDSIEHDVFVRIPPKKRYIVEVDIKSIRKAEPNIVEPNFEC